MQDQDKVQKAINRLRDAEEYGWYTGTYLMNVNRAAYETAQENQIPHSLRKWFSTDSGPVTLFHKEVL